MVTIAKAPLPMATALIGPEKWRTETMRELKHNHDNLHKSDFNVMQGRYYDTLPHMKEHLAEQSNDIAYEYMRHVRIVVNRLREAIIDVNEELKRLTKARESLEKELENIRKGLLLNQQSRRIRLTRPTRESDFDGADDLLKAEQQHLLNLKRNVEGELKRVLTHMQCLNNSRTRLQNVLQERAVCLNLICNSASAGTSKSRLKIKPGYFTTLNVNTTSYKPFQVSQITGGGLKIRDTTVEPISDDNSEDYVADPVGPFTPECAAALEECRQLISDSNVIYHNAKEAVAKSRQIAEAAHRAVNSGIDRKLAETITLAQNLEHNLAANRAGMNRAQSFYDKTYHSYMSSLGPERYRDLAISDRLDRPLIRNFQKHPGNQLPEARQLLRASTGLTESLQKTSSHIGGLKLARILMQDDLQDKKVAASIDSSITHLRRKAFDNRWTLEGSNPQRPFTALELM